jgi:hypothetical protein
VSDDVYVGLIAAAVSVGALIWNLATTRVSRSLALSAEEAAKRGELVRVHALRAIDVLLESVAEMLAAVGGLVFLEKHGIAITFEQPEVQKQIKTIGEERSKVARIRVTSAPYLTRELLNKVDGILARTEMVRFDEIRLIESDLKVFVNEVSQYARAKYLE